MDIHTVEHVTKTTTTTTTTTTTSFSSVKKQSRLGLQLSGRGGGGGAGRERRWGGAGGDSWCSSSVWAATSFSSSSKEWWTFLLCGSFVYPPCKLCSRPSKFSRCRSWTRFLTARCCASTGTWPCDHAATSSQQVCWRRCLNSVHRQSGASLWTETGTLGKLWRFHRCSS